MATKVFFICCFIVALCQIQAKTRAGCSRGTPIVDFNNKPLSCTENSPWICPDGTGCNGAVCCLRDGVHNPCDAPCPHHQKCVLRQVECFAAPCFPEASCI